MAEQLAFRRRMQPGRDATSAIELSLERRRPDPEASQSHLGGRYSEFLNGRIVEKGRASDDETEDETTALAVNLVRRHFNKHHCQRVSWSDPPCQDRRHWRDVALMRAELRRIGLPGVANFIPLGYAAKDAYRARNR
jgi:hypothetical protein